MYESVSIYTVFHKNNKSRELHYKKGYKYILVLPRNTTI